MMKDETLVIKGPSPLKPIPNISLGKLIYNRLQNFNDEAALIDAITEENITYKHFFTQTCYLAESLKTMGYGQNTIITICSDNCKEFFIPVIAALYIGAILSPVNHNYTKLEMIHVLNISKPKVIFCSAETYSKFLELRKELIFIEKIIVFNSAKITHVESSFDDVISRYSRCRKYPEFDPVQVDPKTQVGFIMCSSGTTGLPKGVMLTHQNVISTFVHTEDPRFFTHRTGRYSLAVLPFFHSYGLFRTLNHILQNTKVVVMKKFEETLFLSSIEKYKITTLNLVPPLAIFLAKSPLVDNYDLTSISEATCGASPLKAEIEELLKKRLKIKSLRQSYGLTETTLGVMAMPVGHQRFGSSGKLYSSISCKIRDPETGKSLGPNQVGELCFKGPLIMKGYWNSADSTRHAFTEDGWFLSGDLGCYDEEEYFYIVDRLKELIKYKGFQVAPAELESMLLMNPKIQDAGVIGVLNDDGNELPLAFVVPNPGVHLTEDEVKKFIEERVSSHKRLRGGVIFVSEIPKNPSGKILRRMLRDMVKKNKSKL